MIWLNVVGSTGLVAIEVFALSASFDWALSGLLGLPGSFTLGLAIVLLAASAAITWAFARRALIAETKLASAPGPNRD
jgi:hypothetical protein